MQDPFRLPEGNYLHLAQWYGGFVTYLLFQDFWFAFGTTYITTALRYGLITWLLWARNDFVYDWVLFRGIDFSDIWVSTILLISGIFIAYLLCYVIQVPLIARNPWTLYDRLRAMGFQVVHKSAEDDRKAYMWHILKYYVFIVAVQYGGTGILFLLGMLSKRGADSAVVLYFVIQLLLIVVFVFVGYRSQLERQAIWKAGLLSYGVFLTSWTLFFVLIYFAVFLLYTVPTVIVILFYTLFMSVVLTACCIVRFCMTE